VLRNVRITGAGKITLDGFDATHRLGMVFDNLYLDTPKELKITASHGDFTLGPGNLAPAGEDVKVNHSGGKATPNTCSGKFVPLPDRY
jgi:hypothetical protein